VNFVSKQQCDNDRNHQKTKRGMGCVVTNISPAEIPKTILCHHQYSYWIWRIKPTEKIILCKCKIFIYKKTNYIKNINAYIYFFIISGVGLSPLGTAATSGLLYKPQMINEGDCGAIGGMKSGRGNRSTRRKPAQAPLCPSQIPQDQIRARTRATAVGSQRLTS
jgi:hypothetical protein